MLIDTAYCFTTLVRGAVAYWRRLLSRLWNLMRPSHAERELAREISAHLRLLEDEFSTSGTSGMSPADAHIAAKRAFGELSR